MFGNVKDFIAVTMVKQKYLNTELEDVTKKVLYSWGPKADHEISKHSLLKFICTVSCTFGGYDILIPSSAFLYF